MTTSSIRKSIDKAHDRRRAFFTKGAKTISETNLQAAFALSASVLGLCVVFCFVAVSLLSSIMWRPSIYHFAAVAIFAVLTVITGFAYHGKKTTLSFPITIATQIITFCVVICVDVFGTTQTTGSFMPIACVILPFLFILRLRVQLPIVFIACIIYVALVANVKASLFVELDVFRVAFCVIAGIIVREAAMSYRLKVFETSITNWNLSRRDSITGLYNRRGAFEAIQKRISKSNERLSCVLAVVDIDEFKAINDHLGHLVGDVCIQRVGKILDEALNGRGVIGRFGGDEYVLFLENSTEYTLKHLFKACEKDLSTIIYKETGRLTSCSVGAVVTFNQKVDLISAFKQADRALYASKTMGKQHITVVPYQTEIEADDDHKAASASDVSLHLFYEQGEKRSETENALAKIAHENVKDEDVDEKTADSAHELASNEIIKSFSVRDYVSNTILVVDDEEINRAILSNLLSSSYKIEEASSGKKALDLLIASPRKYCAVLLDILMDDVDGLQVLEGMQKTNLTSRIPVFIITADASDKTTEKAYDLGAVDVINKPIVPHVVRRRVELITEVYRSQAQLGLKVEGQNLELLRQSEKIIELTRGLIEALSTAIEFRDNESGDHVHRIYHITRAMLTQTDLGENLTMEEVDAISLAAIMHDVGKIAIPDSILQKVGKLTTEEFEIMKTHTIQGEQLLASIPQLKSHSVYEYALDIARHHHERWDGRGYPDGLVGDEISIWAQIVALADVYDALTNKRHYKDAYSHDEAMRMILNGECGTFNPNLLDKFVEVMADFTIVQDD